MDAVRFDLLTRSLARSRRSLLGVIGGAALAVTELLRGQQPTAARKKRKCKGGKTRCGKRCADLTSNRRHCGACNTACDDDELCAEGSCVPGPGTCTAGDDICDAPAVSGCNGNAVCDCATRFEGGQLVCGGQKFCATACTTDADCVAAGNGVFCARKTGSTCCTGNVLGEGFCMGACTA